MLINDGILSQEELERLLPSDDRFRKGPVAIIECIQDIPCDPCVGACPAHAITMREGITDRPHLDADKCTGCGLCLASCPGLAIFLVNVHHSKDKATVSLPYELLPVPQAGDFVAGLDREGKPVCRAKVLRVLSGKKLDHTRIITVEVPRRLAMTVRGIRCKGASRGAKGGKG